MIRGRYLNAARQGVLALIVVGLVGPILMIGISSLFPRGQETFSTSYSQAFAGYRWTVIGTCAIKAAIALVIIYALVLVPLNYAVLAGRKVMLRVIEIALLIPFSLSASLRLFGLRELLSAKGIVATIFPFVAPESLSAWLLFHPWSEIFALSLSYGALVVLPYLYDLKAHGSSIIDALNDTGVSHRTLATRTMLGLGGRGLRLGIAVFMAASVFAEAEYTVIGAAMPVAALIKGLLREEARNGAAALSVVLLLVTLVVSALLLRPLSGRSET